MTEKCLEKHGKHKTCSELHAGAGKKSILSSLSGVYGFVVSYVGSRILDYLQHNSLKLWGRVVYAQ